MCAAISRINSSLMGPGPLGISETSPSADAPMRMTAQASSTLAIQQILTRGFTGGFHLTPLLWILPRLARLFFRESLIFFNYGRVR